MSRITLRLRNLFDPKALTVLLALLWMQPTMAQSESVAARAERFHIDSEPQLRPMAREVTLAYRHQHFIAPGMNIPDGYIDGGRGMKIHDDGRVGSGRELIIVDRPRDARLRKLLAFARRPEVTSLAEHERAVNLAAYLNDFSNGNLDRHASSKATDSLAATYRGRGVLIGDIVAICGGASCRHRTLLYKLLADEAGLAVSMVRGKYRHSNGRLGNHAWNELYLKNGQVLLVDIMNPARDWKFPSIREERPKRYLGPNAEALYTRTHVVWPPLIRVNPKTGSSNHFTVTIFPPASDAHVFLTLDDTEPSKSSPAYQKPLTVPKETIIKSVAIYPDGFMSRIAQAKAE